MEVAAQISISNWMPIEGYGSLVGSFSIELPVSYGTLRIHGLTYYEEDGRDGHREWVCLPRRKHYQDDGTAVRIMILEFETRAQFRAFQGDVIAALHAAGIPR
jgi:hypothetical protein